MPSELSDQVTPIIELIRSLGITIIQESGVEADDVIATLAKNDYGKDINILISSGDKDLAQLVNERVVLVNSMDNKILDIEGVIKKFGIPPKNIFDYLVLVGDKSDNIPGVDKVGPKTAISLLEKYKNLDSILENVNTIKGKVSENLSNSIESFDLPSLNLPEGIPERGWMKLSTFASNLHDLSGKTLFLDLDLVIINNIDGFFDQPGDFLIIKDFRKKNFIGNSSVYRFEIGKYYDVLEHF